MENQMENLMDNVNCVSYPRTGKRGVPQQFPRRLYNMLEAESQLQPSDNQCLIAWSSTGKAFRIEDVNLFSTLVLPKYFRTSKFSSFQRNLNLYGFNKVRRGPDADMYAHPSFLRGRPEFLSELKKCKSAADRKRQAKPQKLRAAPLSAGAMREILPNPSSSPVAMGISHDTRAVSPSSSSEEGFSVMKSSSNFYSHHRQDHPYGNARFNSALVSQLSSQVANRSFKLSSSNIQMSSAAVQASNPRSPGGKLGLLTLAMTCLAESNAQTTSD